jgi:hypothetical protein
MKRGTFRPSVPAEQAGTRGTESAPNHGSCGFHAIAFQGTRFSLSLGRETLERSDGTARLSVLFYGQDI